MSPSAAGIHQARQERSRDTHQRLLDAAEEVLAEKPFAEASLAEIATRAGFTVGAFYGRFAGKRALLDALEERLRSLYREETARLRTLAAEGASLERLLGALLDALLRTYRDRRALARAMTLAIQTASTLRERRDRLNSELATELTDLLLTRRHEIGHPDPPRAIAVALLIAVSTLREAVLVNDLWPGRSEPDAGALRDELHGAVLAYLGVRPVGGRPDGGGPTT